MKEIVVTFSVVTGLLLSVAACTRPAGDPPSSHAQIIVPRDTGGSGDGGGGGGSGM
jgi:hypothetical protein